MMKKPDILRLFKILICTIMLASCAQVTRNPTDLPKSPTVVNSAASFISEYTLVGLTLKSDLIVRGRITGIEGIMNMARDVNDHNKPDPKLFGIGQIYNFEVTQRIKASGSEALGAAIKIMQAEGLITSPTTRPPTKEEIEAANKRYPYSPLIIGQEYILFLQSMKEFDDLKGFYTGTAHPWQFILDAGCAYAETPWFHARYFYSPQEIEKFVAEITASLSASVTPQPKIVTQSPGGKSACPPRVKTEAPYP